MPQSKKLIVGGLVGCAVVLTLIFAALDLAWWWPMITLLILAGGVFFNARRSSTPNQAQGQASRKAPRSNNLVVSTPEEARALVERYTKHPARQRDRQVKHKEPDYNPALALVIEHIVSLVLQPLTGNPKHLEQCFKALSAEILRQTMLEAEREQRKFYEHRAHATTLPVAKEPQDPELNAEVKQHLLAQGVHPVLITAAMAYAHRRLTQGQVKPWEELKWFELRPQAIGSVLIYIDALCDHPDYYDLSPELCASYRKLATKLRAMPR